VKRAYLLADKKRRTLPVDRLSVDQLVIGVPEKAPDAINTVVVLEIEK
jgi:hypothetical protein